MKSLEKSNLLFDKISSLIHTAKQRVVTAVNIELVTLYWSIGNTIRKEILKENRAEYGTEIIINLSKQLIAEFGKGFSKTNLTNFIHFSEVFPDLEIVHTLCKQLSCSHFSSLIYIKH